MVTEMLCILTIKVSISVVVLLYSFAGCYQWEKLGKEHTISVLFLTTANESTIISELKV